MTSVSVGPGLPRFEAQSTKGKHTRILRGAWRSLEWLGLLCALFSFACAAHAQISPGPLARAHQSLSGDANCIKCHEVSTRAPSFRCLTCHREIAAELEEKRGLHATFPQSGAPGTACVKCHSDHNGVDFQMVHWTPTAQGFDHSKTGYALDGKHAGVSCRACHNAQHISAQARALLADKDMNRTWLGLSPSCITCHADQHQGRFGSECARCHTTADWKGASIDAKSFDHSKTRFPLTGEHKFVLCKSCHTAGADGQARYTGLKFASCADCHRDPHQGEFKQECSACHTTSTWKGSSFAATFDHSKTAFPLAGMHVKVPCISCHQHADFKAPIAHAVCADCHTPDPHGGQFAKRADGGKCESCHTVAGWSPSTFAVADHAKTGFPLTFPHGQVKCASCHTPAGKETRFKIKFAQCVDCHKDEHQGQFAGAPWHNECQQCHQGATFQMANYTLAKHQKSAFPLTGGHAAVACIECHKPMQGSQVAVYHFHQLTCTTCHEDVHRGQFAERMRAPGAAGKPLGCEACHTTETWKDVSKFDHSRTQFPLLGTHRAVGCADCHRPPNMELTLQHVQFSAAPTVCSECHENPHADQFGVRGKDCASCHDTNKWRPSLFDHDKTIFPLKGGHEDVGCSACHTLKKQVAGREVLFYKPTPTACSDCHGANTPTAGAGHKSPVPKSP
ncbi:MAG: cytochrome c3 family protein [Terracidiphilus sp.]